MTGVIENIVFIKVQFRKAVNVLLLFLVSAWMGTSCSDKNIVSDNPLRDPSHEFQVGPDGRSSLFGFYNTSPESPDGSKVAYVTMLEDPVDAYDLVPGELWVCRRDSLTNHLKIADIGGICSHNGVELQWVSNELIAIRDRPADTLGRIRIINSETGQLALPPLVGTGGIGQDSWNNRILFDIPSGLSNSSFPDTGIYELNVATGVYEPLIRLKNLSDSLQLKYGSILASINPIPWKQWRISHLLYSPSGDKIAFVIEVTVNNVNGQLIVNCLRDGSDLRLMNNKPNHFLWYSDEEIVGHIAGFNSTGTRPLHRVDRSGNILEIMSPTSGNHLAISPNKLEFLSDTRNDYVPIKLLHISTQSQQSAELVQTIYVNTVFNIMFHMNPSFSRDGQRVYYNKPLNDYQSGTFCYKLTP